MDDPKATPPVLDAQQNAASAPPAAAPPPLPPPPAPPAPRPETRWAESAEAVPWVMTLDELVARGACTEGLERFDARTNGSGVWSLELGWTRHETRQLAREAPSSLLWYARKGLIPVSLEQAKKAIDDAQTPRRRNPLADGARKHVPRARSLELDAMRIAQAERVQ
jgi:hypothetical protein